MSDPDILTATKPVVEAFERLGVQYFIGGSVASSLMGSPVQPLMSISCRI